MVVDCIRRRCYVGDEDLGNRFVEDGEGGWFEPAVGDDGSRIADAPGCHPARLPRGMAAQIRSGSWRALFATSPEPYCQTAF